MGTGVAVKTQVIVMWAGQTKAGSKIVMSTNIYLIQNSDALISLSQIVLEKL